MSATVTVTPAGANMSGGPLPTREVFAAPNPGQLEHEAARVRARAERERQDADRAERVRIAAFEPITLAELLAPESPFRALDQLGAYLAEIDRLADRLERGIAPDAEVPTPADVLPAKGDVMVMLGADSKPDVIQSTIATDAKHRERVAAMPRAGPMPVRASFSKLPRVIAVRAASEAVETLRTHLTAAHHHLSAEVAAYRAAVERYLAACDASRREFSAAQQAALEAAAAAEAAELQAAIDNEEHRVATLARAKALGVKGGR